jgi:hypothetical protein
MDERREIALLEARRDRERELAHARREFNEHLAKMREFTENFRVTTEIYNAGPADLAMSPDERRERDLAYKTTQTQHHDHMEDLQQKADNLRGAVTRCQERLDMVDLWEAAGGRDAYEFQQQYH